ncbi:MAG: UDP-N-acetylmuramoyl-tripeptide--D-alanyl-D-alanine ligase [Flavobacteriales bacterium]
MINKLYTYYLASEGVCTDTRHLQKNQIYFALKGDQFDGNQYANQALEKGATYAVVSTLPKEMDFDESRYLLVDDTLKTLQYLANHHRKQLDIPILGITGTNGKTTSKELCQQVISKKYTCFATKGNLNNHIGVPLSLLSIDSSHDFAIIEMGANHPLEIKMLCEIAEPNLGLITNIGKAHLEGFGSVRNIQKTKKELFDFVSKQNQAFFYCQSEVLIAEFAHAYPNSKSYGTDAKANFVYQLKDGTLHAELVWGNQHISSQLFGSHNAQNIAAACAIGSFLDINSEDIKSAIETYQPKNNRSQVLKTEKNTLILDAYNANPTSMYVALDHFLNLNIDSKICILGDMLELGSEEEQEHKASVEQVFEKLDGLKRVFFVGEAFCKLQDQYTHNNCSWHKDIETCKAELKTLVIENQHILLKGSRGIGLEQLIPLL